MSERWSVAVGLAGAGAGVVLWACTLTLVQGPGVDVVASNNSYWARDLRWMALVAVFVGLVLALRGHRRGSAGAGLGVLALVGVDVVLDRLDLSGGPAAAALAAAVGALIVTAGLLARRDAPGLPTRRDAARGRGVLVLAASVAAATAPLAAAIESPTDTEPALTPLALVTGGLLAAMAVAGAVAAAPDRSPARLATAGALAAAGGATVVLLRVVEPGHRTLPFLLLGSLLLAGVAAVVCPWRRGTVTTVLVVAVGYPLLLFMTAVVVGFMVPVGTMLTAAAGNPPVNGADTDLLVTLVGVLPGLALGGLLAVASRTGRRWVPLTSDRLPA
jgi:hypothetical protein